MILKGSDQFFLTPALRTTDEMLAEARAARHRARPAKKLGPAFQEMLHALSCGESAASPLAPGMEPVSGEAAPVSAPAATAEEPLGPPPVGDPAALRSWEFAAAIDVALRDDGRPALEVPSPEEIAAVLDQVFHEPSTTLPEEASGEEVFEITYEEEIRCLVKSQVLDPRWVPAGMIRNSDRSNQRN